MAIKIKPHDLSGTLDKIFDEYAGDARDVVKESVRAAGKTAAKLLKEDSPKLTGDYAKNWAVKEVSESSYYLETVVHNVHEYQLTHLLENGHAKRGGGRVSPIVHIKPVEESVSDDLEAAVKRALGNV